MLDGKRVQAASDTFGYAARRFVSRHRREMAAGAVAATAVAAVAFALWRSGRPATSGARGEPQPRRSPPRDVARGPAVQAARPAGGDAVLELGMADTLITKLSGVPGIDLRPLGAVVPRAGEGDAPTVGRTCASTRSSKGASSAWKTGSGSRSGSWT